MIDIDNTIVVAIITMIGSIAVAIIANKSSKKQIDSDNMQDIIKSLTEQKNDYKDEAKKQSQEIEKKKAKIEELNTKIRELENEINELKLEIKELKIEKQKLIEENYVLKSQQQ